MENRYLTKICALLNPEFGKRKSTKVKPLTNMTETKIKKLNKKRKLHNGDTAWRQHKVYK